jgi:hypothetical protein
LGTDGSSQRAHRGVGRLGRRLLLPALFVFAAAFAPQGFAAHVSQSWTCPTGNDAVTNTSLTVVQGGTATASFKIAPGCSYIRVSLASYDAPAGDFQLPQTLIDSKTHLYNAGGPYTQTVNVSPCYYQVDFVLGAVITNLTNSDLYGTRKILWKNGGSPCASKMTTTASAAVDVGGSISDSAILSGVSNGAGGTITFKAYPPSATTCLGTPAFTSAAIAVHASGTYSSGSFTPTLAGTYRWTAAYTGDAQNAAVPLSGAPACNVTGESTNVNKRSPSLSTVSSAPITLGGAIADTATLAGTYSGTGTITFNLYGPNDAGCGTPIFTSAKTVSGNGNYGSDAFTPTAAGTYRWIASYGGDLNNNPISGTCTSPNESVLVSPRGPSMSTQVASATVKFGTPVSDTATLTGSSLHAGVSITFRLYGPNDATCGNTPVFTSAAIPVNGDNTYASGSFMPTLAGVYRWTATYLGDLNNLSIPAACNLANESVTVGDKDTTPPACLVTGIVAGPPKQVTISVQDAESGLASIVVNTHTNASVATSPDPFTVGTTGAVLVTGTKTNQSQSSFIRLTVTNTAGLSTVCDPLLPAVKKTPAARHRGTLRPASSGFSFAANVAHVIYGATRGVTLSGTIPGAAGQTVTLMSQSCKIAGAGRLATVRIGKGGAYTFHFQPALSTVFSLSWQGVTKTAHVSVQPVVALTRESAGRYRVDVSTTNGVFLDGKRVELQRKAGSRWVTVVGAQLAKSSSEDLLTVTSSAILAANVYGATLRAVLPASACYAGAASGRIAG